MMKEIHILQYGLDPSHGPMCLLGSPHSTRASFGPSARLAFIQGRVLPRPVGSTISDILSSAHIGALPSQIRTCVGQI